MTFSLAQVAFGMRAKGDESQAMKLFITWYQPPANNKWTMEALCSYSVLVTRHCRAYPPAEAENEPRTNGCKSNIWAIRSNQYVVNSLMTDEKFPKPRNVPQASSQSLWVEFKGFVALGQPSEKFCTDGFRLLRARCLRPCRSVKDMCSLM